MGVKEKLLLLGVLLAIAVAFLGHNYWPCVVAVLQRLVAVAFAGAARF
jgi:hypothetical protein